MAVNARNSTTSTHSGTCSTGFSKALDGPFTAAKYEHLYDLATFNQNQSHIYLTYGDHLRLIDQLLETVTTLYTGEWYLRRIAFQLDRIYIGGSKGILMLHGSNYSDVGLVQLNNSVVKQTRYGKRNVTSPYGMGQVVRLSQNLILASCSQNDLTKGTERLALFDVKKKQSAMVCNGDHRKRSFCGNKVITPGFLTIINETLYIAQPKGYVIFGDITPEQATGSQQVLSFQAIPMTSKLQYNTLINFHFHLIILLFMYFSVTSCTHSG